jgi:hypothetical protein
MKRKITRIKILVIVIMIFSIYEVSEQKNENGALLSVNLKKSFPSSYENEKDGWEIKDEIQ